MGDAELNAELKATLKELAEHADAAVKADKVADAHRQAIRGLLPKAREQGAGPAELARVIKEIYAAGTISLWTKDFARPDRKGPGRRKATARPSQTS